MDSHQHSMHFDPDAFGSRLRKLREQHELTQVELADLLQTSQGNIAHLETGKRSPGAETILQIFLHFRKHFVYLLIGDTGTEELDIDKFLSDPSNNLSELIQLNGKCFSLETTCGCIEASVLMLIKQLENMSGQLNTMAESLKNSLPEIH